MVPGTLLWKMIIFLFIIAFKKEYNMSGVLNETMLNSKTNDPNSPN